MLSSMEITCKCILHYLEERRKKQSVEKAKEETMETTVIDLTGSQE